MFLIYCYLVYLTVMSVLWHLKHSAIQEFKGQFKVLIFKLHMQ